MIDIKKTSGLALSLLIMPLLAWKGPEPTGEQPVFFGTLKSTEGNLFNVTNVSVGRSANGREKIRLYEKPKNLKAAQKRLSVNPYEELTTALLELTKIKKIMVPQPHTMWTWTNPESKRKTPLVKEFIEIVVTWRSGSSVHYLLELGEENTKRPVKLFCDVIDKSMQARQQDGTLFCLGIKKEDLRRKGAPFPSIDVLELEEPCYKVPTENGGSVKSLKS